MTVVLVSATYGEREEEEVGFKSIVYGRVNLVEGGDSDRATNGERWKGSRRPGGKRRWRCC